MTETEPTFNAYSPDADGINAFVERRVAGIRKELAREQTRELSEMRKKIRAEERDDALREFNRTRVRWSYVRNIVIALLVAAAIAAAVWGIAVGVAVNDANVRADEEWAAACVIAGHTIYTADDGSTTRYCVDGRVVSTR